MQISSKKLKDIAEHASNPLAKSILNLVLPAFEDIEALDARVKALESPMQREGLTVAESESVERWRGKSSSAHELVPIIDRLTSPPEKPTPVPTQGVEPSAEAVEIADEFAHGMVNGHIGMNGVLDDGREKFCSALRDAVAFTLDSFARSKSERIRDETLEEAAERLDELCCYSVANELRSMKSIQPEGKK
jgi:hypothetical protein